MKDPDWLAWAREPAHRSCCSGWLCVWWLIALVWLLAAPARHHRGLALLCGIPVLLPAFIALARLLATTQGIASGAQIVLWLVLLVIAADIGAYFAGRSLGKRRLAPRVSPGTTWEGALGGLAMVALVACGGAVHFGLAPFEPVAFGCAVGIFLHHRRSDRKHVQACRGLKDSGAILPGHGGLLDRIDSVTAAAPLYALGLFGAGVIA